MAHVSLPPAPAAASVLRVTVTPTRKAESVPASDTEHRGSAAERGPTAPWTLFPIDQPGTFVVRVPSSLVEASRTGQRVILSVRPATATSGAAPTQPASVSIIAIWGTP